jgi:hypothetical protein
MKGLFEINVAVFFTKTNGGEVAAKVSLSKMKYNL